MKIKVSEATNIQLNWLVTMAIGEYKPTAVPNYTTDWAQGGPIIEREKITTDYDYNGPGLAWVCRSFDVDGNALQRQYGTTPLIAAMRCYVASKLGDKVEIPGELNGTT